MAYSNLWDAANGVKRVTYSLQHIYWKRKKAKNQLSIYPKKPEKRIANETQSKWKKKEQKIRK